MNVSNVGAQGDCLVLAAFVTLTPDSESLDRTMMLIIQMPASALSWPPSDNVAHRPGPASCRF